MARTPTKSAMTPDSYDPEAFYETRFAKVVDLGDMKLRPAHHYPSISGSLLASLPPDAILSAKKIVPVVE